MKRIVNEGLTNEPDGVIDTFKSFSQMSVDGYDVLRKHTGKKVRSYLFSSGVVAFVMDGKFDLNHGMVRIVGDNDNYVLLRGEYCSDFVIKVSDGQHVFDFKTKDGDVTIDFDYFA